jgi:hypothetical protein
VIALLAASRKFVVADEWSAPVSKDLAPWEMLYPTRPNDPPTTYDELYQKMFPRIPLGSPGARRTPVLASIEHVSKYRLHVEPYGDEFAVFDGEELKAVCALRSAAVTTMRWWQGQINAGKEPDWHDVAGRDSSAEIVEQIERLKRLRAIKTPAEEGREGGKKGGENRRKDALDRRTYARSLIIAAVRAQPGSPRIDVFDEVQRHWTTERLACYERTSIYGLINGLIEDRILLLREDKTLFLRK